MKKVLFLIGVLVCNFGGVIYAQQKGEKQIKYTSERTLKNEAKYPGALLMYEVNDQQVTFTHEGIKVWCDQAIFYKKDNFFRASGHVKMVQGDTITLTSGYAEYDGKTRFAFASNHVQLQTPTTTLTTDSLFFSRQKQEAFYRSGGTVRDSTSVITSRVGRYYANQKKYSFLDNVVVKNDQDTIHSDHIDFYTQTGKAYLYGPTTITGKKYKVYCERGFYDTHKYYGNFVKKATVFYDNRILKGDSIYFNRKTHFASATNNIKVIDTANQSVVYGNYAEVYRDKDSVFITKRAYVAKKQGQDSIFIHSDTLMVTGKPDHRILRAFYNARFYKKDMNGCCDSIFVREDKGITKMIGQPIVFSGLNQLTGDTIKIFSDTLTNKLDSLSVYDHAFLIQKDTLGGYNQVKGKYMYGLFTDNELTEANFIKNTETIFYYRNKEGVLQAINKAIASAIRITFEDKEIRSVTYKEQPDAVSYVPSNLPKNARKLRGFNWRGDERILSKEQLFEGDPPITLPKIRGIPLPKVERFFGSPKDRNQPLMNEKSRLTPEILQDHSIETDSVKTQQKKLQFKVRDSIREKPKLKMKLDSASKKTDKK